MKTGRFHRYLLAAVTATLVVVPMTAMAGEPFNLLHWLTGGNMDLKTHECSKCGGVHDVEGPCITRVPVEDCVKGKKKVYDCKIKYQYVTIPETRYRWKKKLITEEIPASFDKPVCASKECTECYGKEEWEVYSDKKGEETHCKQIVPTYESNPSKYCDHTKGETTIKVHYWSCVKEPYTVYRRVKREVCVKQPRYEHVEVPVTRYVCEHCHGGGCGICLGGDGKSGK